MNRKNIGTLITIIVLLVIMIPCSIIGTINHFKDSNENHLFKYEGSLYFYDKDDLLGTYTCKSSDCDYASYKIINGENEEVKTSMINKRFAFIKDKGKVILFDINSNTDLIEYDNIYSYKETIKDNSYITDIKGKLGLISVDNSIVPILSNTYDNISLFLDGEIRNNEYFSVKEKDLNIFMDREKNKIFETSDEIIEGNKYFVAIQTVDGEIQIYNHFSDILFEDLQIDSFEIIGNYFVIYDNSPSIRLYSFTNTKDKPLSFIKDYDISTIIKLENSSLNVYNGEEIIDSYN